MVAVSTTSDVIVNQRGDTALTRSMIVGWRLAGTYTPRIDGEYVTTGYAIVAIVVGGSERVEFEYFADTDVHYGGPSEVLASMQNTSARLKAAAELRLAELCRWLADDDVPGWLK